MTVTVPTVEEIIAKFAPLPVAEGTVKVYKTGWTKAYFYDPVTKRQVKFKGPPTVVATAEARSGKPPVVTAPTISIPTIDLPEAPTISIPEITLPPPVTITVPTFNIPYAPKIGGRFVCGAAFAWLCSQLNPMLDTLDNVIDRVNDGINAINDAFAKVKEDLQATVKEISALRDNIQKALSEYQTNIETSVNGALADVQNKAQDALNAYRNNIQASVNIGLSKIIPALYDQVGVPISDLITPVQIRNVTTDSFEFYSLSPDYTIHYIAVGTKL